MDIFIFISGAVEDNGGSKKGLYPIDSFSWRRWAFRFTGMTLDGWPSAVAGAITADLWKHSLPGLA